jgi:hypothetical protein
MDQGAGFVTYHNRQERDRAREARMLLAVDEGEGTTFIYVVELGSVRDEIEAYDQVEAVMGFIEKHGIDQSEHDYISVVSVRER